MKAIPVRQRGDAATLELLQEQDAPWIAALIDEVEAAVGRPWRELLERIARLPTRVSAARHAVAVEALRSMLSGRARGTLAGLKVRDLVLGRSALDAAARDRRLADAAAAARTTVDAIAAAMWSDLPAERVVVMAERPRELAVAAAANLVIIQRALGRCHALTLQLTGNARAVTRTAAVRGLLAIARRRGEVIDLERFSGPLALFHATTVYGRALGSIVPHLAWCERFRLEARCDFGRGPALVRLQPPILLPASAAPRRYDSALEARFARDMARRAPGWRVLREPAPVDAGGHLAFPDFLLEHREQPERRWWVELVGFWTSAYLAHKLATYRAARLPNVILCIDAVRAIDAGELPPDAKIIRYTKSIRADDVVAIIDDVSIARPP